MKFFCTLLIVFCIQIANCQSIINDLSGSWKGSYQKVPFGMLMANSYEDIMDIEVHSDSIITGVVHSYYSKGRFTHTRINGRINWKDSTVVISDDKLLDDNFDKKIYSTCFGKEFLKLSIDSGNIILKGKWKDQSTELLRCPSLNVIWVKQLTDSVKKEPVEEYADRVTDIQNLIEIATEEQDSIKITIYDNGEIDGDTVSIYMDNSLIISRQRLSEKPIHFYLTLPSNKKVYNLKMYAENMGSIPPNTALLIITTRKNRYSINLASNFSNNGSVQFFLKE